MIRMRDFKIKPYPYNRPDQQFNLPSPYNQEGVESESRRRGGPLSPIAPGNPREQLSKEEREMFSSFTLKKGGKLKNKKKKKQVSKISQVQKINIKIGADLLKSKKEETGDTAMLMKGKQQQQFPSSLSTNLRLEAPPFKYAQPLPSVIPGLYQANPSSISQPLVSGKASSSRGGDLQSKLNNPIVQDTDPNDLQKNQSRDPMIRAIPSAPSVSGSISGIVGDVPIKGFLNKGIGEGKEAEEYRDYYLPQGGYIASPPYAEKKVVSRRLVDNTPYLMTMTPEDIYIPKSYEEDTGPLQFSSQLTQYPFTGQGPKSRIEKQQEEAFKYLIPSSASSASSDESSSSSASSASSSSLSAFD